MDKDSCDRINVRVNHGRTHYVKQRKSSPVNFEQYSLINIKGNKNYFETLSRVCMYEYSKSDKESKHTHEK